MLHLLIGLGAISKGQGGFGLVSLSGLRHKPGMGQGDGGTGMQKIGCLHMRIWDGRNHMGVPVFVMYPAQAEFGDLKVGAHHIQAGLNAFVQGGNYPLVIISHDAGGSRLDHLALAQHLAASGFVVAMPEHFGNHADDNFLDGSTRNLQLRPYHLSLCIDEVAENGILEGCVNRDQVAVIGHGMGGAAGLALAGGKLFNKLNKPVPVSAEPRLRALVVLEPQLVCFPEHALAGVDVPLLVYQQGPGGPLDQIPDQGKLRRGMSQDAGSDGFDRQMMGEVTDFLQGVYQKRLG
ncbi:MAG: hypothetical protein CSA68_05240 [Rhodobacterales bacterium]|nr:MAG: hypothetical protein CSA68_05240 [Rhodobacterales bacterium]